jgi:hypothetical protein
MMYHDALYTSLPRRSLGPPYFCEAHTEFPHIFFEVIHGNAFLRFYRGDLCNRCSEGVPPDCKVFDVFELVFASERRAKVHHDLDQLDILTSRRLHDSFVV